MSKAVAMTKHGRMRANDRGFPNAMIDLIQSHGTWNGERQVLSERDLRTYVDDLDKIRRTVIRLLDKGGGTAVFGEDDQLITIFSPRTHRCSHRGRRAGLVKD